MKPIKFTDRREFDYGDGLVIHEVGSTATLRDDKAQRWVTRGVAHYVTEEAPKVEPESITKASEDPADSTAETNGEEAAQPTAKPQGRRNK